MNWKNYVRIWQLCWLITALLLGSANSSRAAYPPILVVNGSAYSGVSGTAASDYKYAIPGSVLVLCGSNGSVYQGADEQSALNSTAIGTWNGSTSGASITIPSGNPAVQVPNVLVTYPTANAPANPATMQGSDGNPNYPLGIGINSAGLFVVAYSAPFDGYIFNLGTGLPYYRYQTGPTPITINTGSSGAWPPSNLFAYPQNLYANGQTLSASSFTQGFITGSTPGYFSDQYYASGTTGYANVQVFIGGTAGIMWGSVTADVTGTVASTTISATWNPSTQVFTASQGTGLSYTPSPTGPSYGPPQVEWNGTLLPFKYSDFQGSDVYTDATGATQVVIDSGGNVTASSPYGTNTGYWEAGYFGGGDFGDPIDYFPGEWCWGGYIPVNIAPVSSDGMSIGVGSLGVGFTLYTQGGVSPGGFTIYAGNSSSSTPYSDGLGIGFNYSLQRPDGTMEYITIDNSMYFGGNYWGQYVQFSGCPSVYSCGYPGGQLDASKGWPASNVPSLPQYPSTLYINGVEYEANYNFDWWDYFWNNGYDLTSCYDNPNNGGWYFSNGVTWSLAGYASASDPNDQFALECDVVSGGLNISVKSFGDASYSYQFSSFNGFSINKSAYLSASNVPIYGPAQITWNGALLSFVGDTNGADIYQSGTAVQATIASSGTVTVTGTHCATGTYNFGTYQFNFGSDKAMSGFLALNASGNLLTASPALLVKVTNYNTWNPPPAGWQDLTAQCILFGNDLENGYWCPYNRTPGGVAYQLNQNTACVAYDLMQGDLFRLSDANGNFISPVYRYKTSGSNFVVNVSHDWSDSSSYSWDASNLYPAVIYINGHYSSLDTSSEYTFIDGTGNLSGAANYIVPPSAQALTGGTISISWSFAGTGLNIALGWYQGAPSSFHATLGGSYQGISAGGGTWDGNNIFGNLPPGLVISVTPPPNSVRYGPPEIDWNGVTLVFNPTASAVTQSNPQGNDVYTDPSGSGLIAMIGTNGAVTLINADGSQISGTYSATTGAFTFSGQTAGTVLALDNSGNPTNRGDSNGGTAVSGTMGIAGGVSEMLGNLDIHGNFLTLGTWLNAFGQSIEGLAISFTDAQNQQPTLLRFAAVRQSATWVWSHADTDGSAIQDITMQVDSSNRLLLFDPSPQTTGTTIQPSIVLDPSVSGTSQLPGTVRVTGTMQVPGTIMVNPKGDLLMGAFTTGTAPQ